VSGILMTILLILYEHFLEYVERGSLEELTRRTKLTMKQYVNYFIDIAKGMEFLAGENIVHKVIC
jgi:serine/threonine protein kinase